ncbi:hypothetical protein ENBRE01_1685 [Enteropsectra breve]|nr:hypothetical protein ENBRE01_1685 [Enteropsectra breve]
MTEQLIRAKQNEEMCIKFAESLNKPQLMKCCWQEIGEGFVPTISEEVVKTKYNHLLAKYLNVLTVCGRTGVAAPKWKYWEVFQATFPSNIRHSMPDVLKLGDESSVSINRSTVSEASETTSLPEAQQKSAIHIKRLI